MTNSCCPLFHPIICICECVYHVRPFNINVKLMIQMGAYTDDWDLVVGMQIILEHGHAQLKFLCILCVVCVAPVMFWLLLSLKSHL